jgi:hypothetical protein
MVIADAECGRSRGVGCRHNKGNRDLNAPILDNINYEAIFGGTPQNNT